MAYTVSSMEWTILGDLHRLADRLPDGLVLGSLEPMMTSGIASAVKEAAKAADDGPIKDYLTQVYRALFVVAESRSDVLHARPTTHPAQGQRLSRAGTRNQSTTAGAIGSTTSGSTRRSRSSTRSSPRSRASGRRSPS